MRLMSMLAAVSALAIVPLASHSQSRPADDHSAHHPAQAQAAPVVPGGMDMKGSGDGRMMGGDMSRMMTMMHGGMMGDMSLKHVEGRLAFLKTELKITSAQESQWTKFADAIRSISKSAQAAKPPMMQGGAQAPTAAPDRLGSYEKMLIARLERVRALKAAVDPLYASLSDDQKKVADELVMGPMGIM